MDLLTISQTLLKYFSASQSWCPPSIAMKQDCESILVMGLRLREFGITKVKEGNSVEVLRRENDPCGSWFSGEITLANGDGCIVRCNLLLDGKREQVMEMVPEEYVRPRPPGFPNENGKRWMIGHIAEVFDVHCWKVGKIAKVLKNDRYVVKLFGSIQLKEFHKSNVRIRQAWHNNKWSVVGKDGQNKDNNLTQKNTTYYQSLICEAARQGACDDTHSRENDGQEDLRDGDDHFGMFFPERTMKTNRAYCSKPLSKDPLMGGSCKRRKSSLNVGKQGRSLMTSFPLYKQADDNSSPELRVDENGLNGTTERDAKVEKTTNYLLRSSYGPLWSGEDSIQCSVASCSFNGFPECPCQNSQKSLKKTFDSSDAESSFPSMSRTNPLPPFPRGKLEVDIHELELHAYTSTVQALYASGPLSWEQESLLTNLRLLLHISNEEHLLQLRHLLSTQVL